MKKSIYLLAVLSLFGTNVLAEEMVKTVEPEWNFSGRMYLEIEDFDNGSSLRWQGPGKSIGDDEDGTFFGTGINASKGKLSFDFNMEQRLGGDIGMDTSSAEWNTLRLDFKTRYQVFPNQAFHLKYRNEERTRDYSKNAYQNDWTRDRYELGTDFNHFGGMLAGWLVAGIDRDETRNEARQVSNDNGWYWEGDFGPTFKITEKLSFSPTLYTTGEFYDSYEMVETQLRVMMPYKVNEKLKIMPRIRLTLDRTQDAKTANNGYVTDYENRLGSRIRYELMADYVINDQLSTFIGVAYDMNTRDFKNSAIIGGAEGKKDLGMWWTYVGLNYKFN